MATETQTGNVISGKEPDFWPHEFAKTMGEMHASKTDEERMARDIDMLQREVSRLGSVVFGLSVDMKSANRRVDFFMAMVACESIIIAVLASKVFLGW